MFSFCVALRALNLFFRKLFESRRRFGARFFGLKGRPEEALSVGSLKEGLSK